MIYVKIYREQKEFIVAACDEEILGGSFSEGELKLDVKEDFYMGELMDIDKIGELLSMATIANLSGNKVVDKAIELGFIDEENVLNIAGIKHAQMVLII